MLKKTTLKATILLIIISSNIIHAGSLDFFYFRPEPDRLIPIFDINGLNLPFTNYEEENRDEYTFTLNLNTYGVGFFSNTAEESENTDIAEEADEDIAEEADEDIAEEADEDIAEEAENNQYLENIFTEESNFVRQGRGNQANFWINRFELEEERNYLIYRLRFGLEVGSFNAMRVINRIYHFNYQLVRRLFREQLQQISHENNIPIDLIEIRIVFLDRTQEQEGTATPHVDFIFKARDTEQDPKQEIKWTLIFSTNHEAEGTWIYQNADGEDLVGEESIGEIARHRILAPISNQNWTPIEFNINWLHSSPEGFTAPRLPVHFYIIKKPKL